MSYNNKLIIMNLLKVNGDNFGWIFEIATCHLVRF